MKILLFVMLISANDLVIQVTGTGPACKFKAGDGIGGKEQFAGNMSPEECIAHCFKAKQSQPTINGVTVDRGTRSKCYCEYNMNSRTSDTTWESCIFEVGFSCTFENEFCKWDKGNVARYSFRDGSGVTPSRITGPNYAKGADDPSGRYIYMEASRPAKPGDKFRLISPTISTPKSCMRFYYSMYGDEMGSLRVYSKIASSEKTLWQKKGNQGAKWKVDSVVIGEQQQFQIVIEAVRGKGFRSDIAIDDISITEGDCQIEVDISCTFEYGYCKWDKGNVARYSFRHGSGDTPSRGTGPNYGMTANEPSGRYIYMEASYANFGDIFRLVSPEISIRKSCLKFYYSMYGTNSMGSLRVYSKIGSSEKDLWKKEVNQGKMWKVANIVIDIQQKFQIVIEAVRGTGWDSDIAIDDISVTRGGSCKSIQLTGTCPSSHPYAYNNGQHCCKYKVYAPQGALCDGGTIGLSSKCCKDNKFKPCVSPPCINDPPVYRKVNYGNCNLRHRRSVRSIGYIVGGANAAVGKYPWQIGLVLRSGRRYSRVFCGGTLINTRTVVTAAHCLKENKKYSVRVGDYNRNVIEDGQEIIDVKTYIVHEDYTGTTKVNDIAILILEKEITDKNRPVCIAVNGKTPPVGKKCFISGWGHLKEDTSMGTILQEAQVPIVSNGVCKNAYISKVSGLTLIKSGMICAGYPQGGVDACQGDSGGPMVCMENGKYILHGVTSWGEGCARRGKYGVYTQVSAFENWIKETLLSWK